MPKRPRFNVPAVSFAGALFLAISLTPHEFRAFRPATADLSAQTPGFRGPGLADRIASPAPIDRAAALADLRDLLQEAARRGALACVETPYASALIHPDTPPERLPEILDWLQRFYASQLDPSKSSFYKVGRWSVTASDTNTGIEGDPITLSWSIVPDGTLIDNGSGGHVTSTLQAVFDVNFPTHDTWVNQLRDSFSRWSARAGITYIEAADDGATAPESLGVLGVRGDCRIGGRFIDGSQGILAYNFFPNGGDMVLDVADVNSFKNSNNSYRFLRNTVMHEHGHGIGLGHVIPNNGTKLMEAFLNLGFLGQQDDDIRGGEKLYGDAREQNDDSLSSTVLGPIADTMRVTQLCLDKGGDVDWYRFTSNGGEDVTISVDPIGSTYPVGPEGGTAVQVSTDSILNLQLALYDAAGTQLAITDAAGLGGTEVLSTFPIPAAADYLIRVFKSGTGGLNALQRYEMLVDLNPTVTSIASGAGAASAPREALNLSISPNPVLSEARARFRLAQGSPFTFEVFDLSGRLVRSIAGRAPAGGMAEVAWDGRDARGARLASGVYMLRVQSGALSETERAVLLR